MERVSWRFFFVVKLCSKFESHVPAQSESPKMNSGKVSVYKFPSSKELLGKIEEKRQTESVRETERDRASHIDRDSTRNYKC